MDNLCHTLVGAALGEAGLKKRTRFGNATLMIAANLPDMDVLVFATFTPSLAFRRGWTHGPVAQALLPIALTAAALLIARAYPARGNGLPVRAGRLLLLSYVGVLSHVLLDLLNPYGLRILAPFNWRWFYGDTLFIIDPWLWLTLGVGVWIARRRLAVAPARRALVVAAMYIVAMVVAARAARDIVVDAWRNEHGRNPDAVMVGPMPVTPFSRDVVVDAGPHYERGTFQWLPPRVTFDRATVPKNDADPRVSRAREAPGIRGFLIWSRFPFWTLTPTSGGTRVTVGDMRFAGQTPARFEASTVVRDGGRTED
ncbi:MAG TPA: metal-dependent hydrolase [Vicinamibacterales bacterium]